MEWCAVISIVPNTTGFLQNSSGNAMKQLYKMLHSGSYDERLLLLQSQGGLLWGHSLILRCKMYTKYYLGRTRGGRIRQIGFISGGTVIVRNATDTIGQSSNAAVSQCTNCCILNQLYNGVL